MPETKIVVDCSTGEQNEVAMTAEEIAQRQADTAHAALPPPPTKNAVLLDLLTSMDPADADTELLWLVVIEMVTP